MLAPTVPMFVLATVALGSQLPVQICLGLAAGVLIGVLARLLPDLLFRSLTGQPRRGRHLRADA